MAYSKRDNTESAAATVAPDVTPDQINLSRLVFIFVSDLQLNTDQSGISNRRVCAAGNRETSVFIKVSWQ